MEKAEDINIVLVTWLITVERDDFPLGKGYTHFRLAEGLGR